MPKSKPIDGEPNNHKHFAPSSLYLTALLFKEVAVKREDFDQIRTQSWHQDTVDEMLALIIASSIAENCKKEFAGFYVKSLRGLCNTVKYLYDFIHIRFDGEYYWFSPDKKILAQLKKESRR